jgi:hypothetical protein
MDLQWSENSDDDAPEDDAAVDELEAVDKADDELGDAASGSGAAGTRTLS